MAVKSRRKVSLVSPKKTRRKKPKALLQESEKMRNVSLALDPVEAMEKCVGIDPPRVLGLFIGFMVGAAYVEQLLNKTYPRNFCGL